MLAVMSIMRRKTAGVKRAVGGQVKPWPRYPAEYNHRSTTLELAKKA